MTISIPANNILTLTLNNTAGSLILSAGSPGTAFRLDQENGLMIAQWGSISSLALTMAAVSISFTSGFYGQVGLAITVGPGASLLVDGTFTPGSVMAAWLGQAGGAESLTSGSTLTID